MLGIISLIMTTADKLDLVKQVGEEVITEKELKELLDSEEKLVAYDGFEPSGQMHIAQGILRSININKMTKAGVRFKMLVADWHAMANKKMGGDLDKIRTVGKYFIEVWKATGLRTENVEFIWASDLVKNSDYWKLVLQIAGTNSINRFIRTAEIMGRDETDELTAAQLIYPCMQAADIFVLGAKITQLGMDQRKVNVLAREVGPQLGFWKPVIVSHHMLLGLGKPPKGVEDKKELTLQLKMSKSHPDSAIFMTDSEDDIKRKIGKAWCPEGETELNPVLEYCRYIIFEKFDKMKIDRSEKFGETVDIASYNELEQLYLEKKIHPQDLKDAVIKYLNGVLVPVRKHFKDNPYARTLLEEVQSFQVTR